MILDNKDQQAHLAKILDTVSAQGPKSARTLADLADAVAAASIASPEVQAAYELPSSTPD